MAVCLGGSGCSVDRKKRLGTDRRDSVPERVTETTASRGGKELMRHSVSEAPGLFNRNSWRWEPRQANQGCAGENEVGGLAAAAGSDPGSAGLNGLLQLDHGMTMAPRVREMGPTAGGRFWSLDWMNGDGPSLHEPGFRPNWGSGGGDPDPLNKGIRKRVIAGMHVTGSNFRRAYR